MKKEVYLKDYVKIINNKVDIKEATLDNYVTTQNLLPDRGGITFPAKSFPNTKKVSSFKKGDILISNIRPYFKKIWRADIDGTKSGDVLAFRTISNELLQEYLYIVLQSDNFFKYVTSTSKGTKMPRGDKKAIGLYKFSLPDVKLQEKMANSVLTIERKMKLNQKINDNLAA